MRTEQDELESWGILLQGIERVAGNDREAKAIIKDLRFMYTKISQGHMIMRLEAMIAHRMNIEGRLNQLGILV